MYVQTAEPTDFENVSRISFLPANFNIDEENFSSIPENSLVVLDDFSFKLANNKQEKINFLKVVNYILRHKKITLILVIHNLFGNNLANDILCAACEKGCFTFHTSLHASIPYVHSIHLYMRPFHTSDEVSPALGNKERLTETSASRSGSFIMKPSRCFT